MSSDSSPSPQNSSSLMATIAEAPEVRMVKEEVEEADAEGASSSAAANGASSSGINLTALYQLQSNPAFRAFFAGVPAFNNNVQQKTPQPVAPKQECPQSEGGNKKCRMKVFSNGFFMTYDKLSSCGQKHFWRCEYKNTCKARMHTDLASEKILSIIHDHNHTAPTPDEIRLYGIDPDTIETNRVYVVETPADPSLRRRIRKRVADNEAAQKKMEAVKQEEEQQELTREAILASQAALRASSAFIGIRPPFELDPSASTTSSLSSGLTSAAPIPPTLISQLPFIKRDASSPAQVSPSLPTSSSSASEIVPVRVPNNDLLAVMRARGPVKRQAPDSSSEEDELRRDPLFGATFQLAHKLRKLWKGEPSRYPRLNPNTTTHFDFFLAKDDGSDEHLYMPMRIQQRDEAHLKAALQTYINTPCVGMLLFGVSPKISVMFSSTMLSDWDNHQYFLLNVSNPNRWRLMYVDDRSSA